MMESYFEINVSHSGKHLFATAPRSCREEAQAKRVYEQVVKHFPRAEGFEVTVAYWSCTGIAGQTLNEVLSSMKER